MRIRSRTLLPRTRTSIVAAANWWTWMPRSSVVATSSGIVARKRIRFGGQQAQANHDDRGVARAEPALPGARSDRRWSGLDVEEVGAVERDAREHGVVVRALDQVGKTALAGGEQQPPGEHDAADRRAGLGVGAVGRQLERLAECLVAMPGAEAAGEVRARATIALPACHDGLEQLGIAVSMARSTAPASR